MYFLKRGNYEPHLFPAHNGCSSSREGIGEEVHGNGLLPAMRRK
jgi:hypothetical protein